jgi:lipopolysaccharide export system protein LptA
MTGQYLKYDRKEDIVSIPSSPRLYQYEKLKNGNIDTVTIQSRSLIFDKKNGFAQAFDDVKLTQKDLVVTCDTGYFDRKNNWLSMKGHPTCDMKNYHLTGDSIFLVLDETGKMLKSALVIRNAHGIQNEEPKRGNPGSVTEAFGDTLYAEFSNEKIERLYVNLNARGFFYETDLKDYRNLMDGDRLDLYFNQGKMDRAVVSGKAQSTYFYVKKDRSVSGKNEATGDTIHILFDAQKNAVKSLKLLGAAAMASGRYIDMEKTERLKREAEAAKASEKAAEKELDKNKESSDNKDAKTVKSKLEMMRKIREKAVTPPKDL